MKLYGPAFSPFVARVRTVLHHKGIDYRQEMPPGGSPKSGEYLRLNPIGKVPTLVDGDAAVPESEVICEYLEERFPQPPLLPATPAARAKVRLIGRVADLYVVVPMVSLFRQLDPTARNAELAEAGIAGVRDGLRLLDRFVESEDFAYGDGLTLADCAVPPVLFFVHYTLSFFGDHDPLRHHPKLDAYWMNMNRHSVCGPILDDMDTAFRAFQAGRATQGEQR
jgi:glutathione S-transferase